jgi:hypothetical protein
LIQGNPVKLDAWAYTDNENTQPLPFKARFIPRTEKIEGFIYQEAKEGRGRLKEWDGQSEITVEQFMK